MEQQKSFKVAVIGGGPSGIAAVSELVAREFYPILWIDPTFTTGMMNFYGQVG